MFGHAFANFTFADLPPVRTSMTYRVALTGLKDGDVSRKYVQHQQPDELYQKWLYAKTHVEVKKEKSA
jgi:hypothetical protein